jgi:glutathione S-transferase
MEIYWIRAQAPRRVLALAKHLGVRARYVEMDLMAGEMQRPEYISLNPNMKAPTLVDGEVVLWESSAIMAYLSNRAGSDLWPTNNPAGQVEVLRWLSWNDCHWAPAVAPFYFEHVVKPTFGVGAPDRASLEAKSAELERWAQVLETHLQEHAHPALDRLTIADFQLASMATDWRVSAMPLGRFPAVVAWLDRLMELQAWREPWPEGHDAVVGAPG